MRTAFFLFLCIFFGTACGNSSKENLPSVPDIKTQVFNISEVLIFTLENGTAIEIPILGKQGHALYGAQGQFVGSYAFSAALAQQGVDPADDELSCDPKKTANPCGWRVLGIGSLEWTLHRKCSVQVGREKNVLKSALRAAYFGASYPIAVVWGFPFLGA